MDIGRLGDSFCMAKSRVDWQDHEFLQASGGQIRLSSPALIFTSQHCHDFCRKRISHSLREDEFPGNLRPTRGARHKVNVAFWKTLRQPEMTGRSRPVLNLLSLNRMCHDMLRTSSDGSCDCIIERTRRKRHAQQCCKDKQQIALSQIESIHVESSPMGKIGLPQRIVGRVLLSS